MCFDDTARPPQLPLPRVRGGASDSGDLILTSADGTELLAAYAHPDGPSQTGVVILPDIRGLHPFYKELAVRCASSHSSVVILSGQMTARTSSSRISAAVPGRLRSPASIRRRR